MGFTGGYYTGGGNSAGTVMAILLLLAVVLTVLAFIFIVPENRREKLNAFGKFLHDLCSFKFLISIQRSPELNASRMIAASRFGVLE